MIVAFMEDRLLQAGQQIAQDVQAWGTGVADWTTNRYTTVQEQLAETRNAAIGLTTRSKEMASETLHKSSDLLMQTVHGVADHVMSVTNGAIATMPSSPYNLTQQPSQWINGWLDTVQRNAANGFITEWLNAHPTVHWMMDHPLGTAALLLLVLFLLAGLFKAIAFMTERLWIAILQAPVRLIRWVWRSLFQGVKSIGASNKSAASGDETETHRERLVHVLQRLEAIKQEQDQLLKELQELLE